MPSRGALEKAALWLVLLGTTLGTGLDAFHVFSGVERYAAPAFLGVAWWVAPLFGIAVLAIGCSHPLTDPLLGQRRPRRLLSSIVELSWLLLAYLITATALGDLAIFGLLALIYFNFWFLDGRSWQNLVLSIVTAITGTLIEMILVNAGAFSYLHHAALLGVPFWLPWLYACASLAVGNLGRALIAFYTRGSH